VIRVPPFGSDADGGDLGLPAGELIDTIKKAISAASVSAADPGRDLAVTSVYLKLNTVATVTAGGGLDFRVPFIGMAVKIGASVTREQTQILEMTLVPEPVPGFETRGLAVESALAEAIATVRAVVARAAGGEDPFVLRDSVVELSFGVKKDGSISLGAEGELAGEVTHVMRLALGPALGTVS
jgi:NTP-dependent ternary system trypsin peptidase co-occuring protein